MTGQIIGEIKVQEWTGKELRAPVQLDMGLVQIGNKFRHEMTDVPIAIQIAPDNKWLGVLTQSSVHLFKPSTLDEKASRHNLPFSSGGVLDLNESGILVAVTHSKGLALLSVPELRTVVEIPTPTTKAIAFSPDGCLLGWGMWKAQSILSPRRIRDYLPNKRPSFHIVGMRVSHYLYLNSPLLIGEGQGVRLSQAT